MAEVYFIILKINDVNVSLLPHDDAVQMFLNASDPILLEVCRMRDVSLSQNYSNDGNNTSSRQASELESQGHKVNFVDNQLVLSCNMTESTHTPTSHCTAAPVSGLSAAQSHSSQRNLPASVANANTTKKPKLTLYFPPPPPITQQPIETDARSIVASRAEISNLISNTNSQLLNSVKSVALTTGNNTKASLMPSPRSGVLEEIQISPSPKHKSTAVQTDDSDLVHSLFHATNAESSDAIVEREHNLFEASLAPEIDIEEITLRKSDSNEHLGLTVCYSATGNNMGYSNTSVQNGASMPSEDNENCAEIYISSIQRDSIAGRDGRLRQGDQILQVNGKDVTNKKDTETLIAENNNAVTLLVSRYLYADEDDFNGTCVPGLDDEEDEDDDDDDDEDEYYDNNNLAYENGFITASNCTTEAESLLHRELIGTESTAQTTSTISITPNASQLKSLDELNRSKEVAAIPVSTTKSFLTSNKKIKSNSRSHLLMKYDPLQHQSIKAHLQQVNQELALLNCRVQNMMVKPINYDTDHIYETIPEDSESEPFYCSPYENAAVHSGSFAKHAVCTSNDAVHLQQQKQRVAAWLGMQHTQRQQIANISNRNNSMLHCPQVLSTWNSSTVGSILASSIRSKNGTVRSTANASTIESSSSGTGHIFPNEQDNSSSAYNTGSNNSGTALTLIINSPHLRNIEQNDSEPVLAQAVHSPKNKLTSPKHQNTTASLMKMSLPDETSVGGVHCDYHNVSKLPAESAEVFNGIQQHLSTCTMYTNLANLQQTMLLQQQLFRKALLKQQEQKHFNFNVHEKPQPPPHQPQSQVCAQFTTPNMSEYHFVSSQEVSAKEMRATAVAASASKNEEPMVWKVKKRPDGTRYIVRRPARNRIFPDRTLGINPVRENQDLYTTEDDTISEIKTGRYWTREERKKHIERARQRRQHHQQQLARTTAMRICDRAVIDSSIKCHTQSSKEKAVKPITPIATNQPQQISQKLHIQNSSKLQHHKLQFSSMTASPTETSKNKQPMPTVAASGAAMNPHVTATVDASPESIEPRVDSTTLNTLQKSANGMTAAAGSNAATIMPQPQTATTNEHKLVGLLSVTTV